MNLRPILPVSLLVVAITVVGCRRQSRAPQDVRLVVTAEMHGTLEPCGCNSDPLGDVARIFPLLQGGLLLDAGGLLYNSLDPVGHHAESDARASALAELYGQRLSAIGLGPADLLSQRQPVQPKRFCQNVNAAYCQSAQVVNVNGVRVGVFGVVDPLLVPSLSCETMAIESAPAAAIKQLRGEHADVIVALLSMERKRARALVAGVNGIDIAVVGFDVGEGMATPELVNKTYLVAAAEEGKRAAVITLHGRPADGAAWQVRLGAASQKLEQEKRHRKIEAATAALERWRTDPAADKNFVAAKEKELGELRAGSAVSPPLPPGLPGSFEYDLVAIRRSLARDPGVAEKMKQLDRKIGAENLAAAKRSAPADTQLAYVGNEACRTCHPQAVEFWQKTRHAQAWKSLVDGEKQYHYNCIGCHVTGWNKPSGSALQNVEAHQLVNVGCEVCHGPGARHVTAPPAERKKLIVRKPVDDYCLRECHTKEHSDTFELTAYLRDILGEGHGAERRKQLGSGPTGHELRARATAKMVD